MHCITKYIKMHKRIISLFVKDIGNTLCYQLVKNTLAQP